MQLLILSNFFITSKNFIPENLPVYQVWSEVWCLYSTGAGVVLFVDWPV